MLLSLLARAQHTGSHTGSQTGLLMFPMSSEAEVVIHSTCATLNKTLK